MSFKCVRSIVFAFAITGITVAQDAVQPRTAKEFQAAHRELNGLSQADHEQQTRALFRKAIVLVEENPESKQSEEMLHWILKHSGKTTPEVESAAKYLSSHHATSAHSIRMLLSFAQRPAKWTPELFESFSTASKSSNEFWIVEVTKALHDKSLLEVADEIQATKNEDEFEPRLGEKLVSQLAKASLTDLETKLAQSLSSVADKHGKRRIGGPTVRQFVDGMLYSVRHLRLGKSVDSLKGVSPNGKEISLSNHQGKVALIDFWATWCAPCIGELPELKKANERYDHTRFTLIGVSADRDAKQLQTVMARHGVDWPIIHDKSGRLQTKWQALSLPYYYVLDDDHVVRYRGTDQRLALQAVERLAAK